MYRKHRTQLMPITKNKNDRPSLTNYRLARTNPRRRMEANLRQAKMDALPPCPKMWHRLGPSIKSRAACHRCPHYNKMETIGEEFRKGEMLN